MLRQAENTVKIEGVLSEVDIKPGTFKKNGQIVDSIGGTIIVKVNQTINNEEKELTIPVHMFASKLTNDGRPNPAYASIEKVANEFVSIASAGGEEGADRVRITSGAIEMNEYYSRDNRLVSFPRIKASFVSKIRKEDCHPEASFSATFVVAGKDDEIDRNGEATGRLCVKTIIPGYRGKIDVVPMYVVNEKAISAISSYWEVGSTMRAVGKLDFSSTTEIIKEEVDFGEPIEKVRTISKSDLIITGGSNTPLEGEMAYDYDEVKAACDERLARLEALKEKAQASQSAKAPAANGFGNLGF